MQTWLHWESSQDVRRNVAQKISKLVEDFCKSSDRQKMRRSEEMFLLVLSEYAHYLFARNKPKAALREKELRRIIGDSSIECKLV